jgi:NhaP-type Na+/H+ or K+/H+ antiporter
MGPIGFADELQVAVNDTERSTHGMLGRRRAGTVSRAYFDCRLLESAMTFTIWAFIIGAILITMALLGTLLKRLPLSPGILYLAIGYALGPAGWALMAPDPLVHSADLETMAEIALLISLFSVGLKLGVPLRDKRWYLPLRLAFPSMVLTVAFVAAIGVFLVGLPAGAALLLAAILAPTDPVLASDVQVEDSSDRDRLRFSLTAEGGLNDGAAFPVVILALGLLGLYDFGGGWRWLAVDVLWAIAGGLAIGAALGALIGKLVLYLRTRHHEAVGLDEFLALGLIAIAYGVAQLSFASGFLAVFAAGLALQRIKEHSKLDQPSSVAKVKMILGAESEKELATNSHHAVTYMMEAVQGFNAQLERLAELVVVMVAGAMLSYTYLPHQAVWFLLLLFFLARPVSVWLGLLGATGVSRDQGILISWFGIRGVGSIFYLMYAINHGLPEPLANELIAFTLTTVAASVVLHGISVTPLMSLYAKRKARPRR